MDALISGRSGVAIVVDGDQLFSMHAADPGNMVAREPAELRFLAGEARDFVAVEHASRQEIEGRLLRERDQEDALLLALMILDHELASDTRRQAAVDLDELLSEELLVAAVEGVLYAVPLPEEAVPRLAVAAAKQVGATRTRALVERLVSHQPSIEEVQRAWGLIPQALFDGEREAWRATAVREGIFRHLSLLDTRGESAKEIVDRCVVNPSVRSLANCRDVLWYWIAPLLKRREERDLLPAVEQPSLVRETGPAWGGLATDASTAHEDSARQFPSTSWALLERARDEGAEASTAKTEFAERYHRPILAYLMAIVRDRDEAEELAQGFFVDGIIPGRIFDAENRRPRSLPSYLKSALHNYLRDMLRLRKQQKRPPPDLAKQPDTESRGWEAAPAPTASEAERAFDRAYIRSLLKYATRRVEAIFSAKGQEQNFALFQQRYLNDSGEMPTWSEIGRSFGLTAKVARARCAIVARQFQRILRELVNDDGTAENPAEEIRSLLRALSEE